MLHDRISSAPIEGTRAAAALFAPLLEGLPSERLCVAHLDRRFRLLDVSTYSDGVKGCVRVPLRAIVNDALQLNAQALILAHNHPNGSDVPSLADKRITRHVREVLRELDIRLVDHLLFAGQVVTSFCALSLL